VKHIDRCCLSRLETITDDQFRAVLLACQDETKRRWPRIFVRANELAAGDKDIDYTASEEEAK
jgi:hypothetical protein